MKSNHTSKMRALIVGISGQDGAFLSKLLLDKGYDVFGTTRDLKNHVVIESSLMRPAEIEFGAANPQKAKKILQWQAKSNISDIVKNLIKYELEK